MKTTSRPPDETDGLTLHSGDEQQIFERARRCSQPTDLIVSPVELHQRNIQRRLREAGRSKDAFSFVDPVEIAVDLFATRAHANTTAPEGAVATSPPRRDALDEWVPRFVNPSTLYPLTEDPETHVLAHLLGEPLHTATNAVPDTIPLQFDRLGPEEVGQCLHAVVTTLIEREVATESLESFEPVVRETFESVVDERVPRISESERDGIYAFFQDVLASVVDSRLWTELTDPTTTVRVDQSIDGLAELDDVEIEVHGEADIVVEYPSGDRHVADLKITLAPLSETSRRRYELQVAAYGYLLDQYQSSSCHTRRTVETFGVDRETIRSSWPPEVVERRLGRLVDATSSETAVDHPG